MIISENGLKHFLVVGGSVEKVLPQFVGELTARQMVQLVSAYSDEFLEHNSQMLLKVMENGFRS